MNRTFKSIIMLLLGVMIFPMVVAAQSIPELPADPEVRIGKLENGLTYYIRHNDYPKGQADFHIAQKVGSILEEDNQRGLAHFLEHMCFNGTKNFPGNSIVEWCESVGIKFGRNLNAYTGFDETVYKMTNVPVARESVQDSCLLILHDWADDLLLEGDEIEKERGVIHQEWRRSNTGSMRIIEKILPLVYPGTTYGERLPIGTMDVVDNFEHKALRDYYEKWYRPDLQGLIIVGDIDVDRIEAKIKEIFSPIKMPENVAERVYQQVPDNEGTIIAIGHDKEMQNAQIQLMFKSDVMPAELKNTQMFYVQNYVEYMIDHMLQGRLDEISSKPDAPYAGAGVSQGNFFVSKTKDAFTLIIVPHEGRVEEGIAAVYREFLRAARHGFTYTEFERAKNEYESRIDRVYNNRSTRENSEFTQAYIDNFLNNEPIPPIDIEYNINKALVQQIPLELINQALAEAYKAAEKDNRVLMALLPENAEGKYPTEEGLLAVLAATDAETLEPYADNVKTEPLIPQLPAAGKVVKTRELPEWGAIEWTLSNGARVIVKSTKFKEDEILFSARETGRGTALFGNEYADSKTVLPLALRQMGMGTFNSTDMQKYLSGKQAYANFSFGDYSGVLSGQTTPKDLPTLMELIYASFTMPNFDTDEFTSMKNTYAAVLHNQESNPEYQFQKFLLSKLYPSGARKALSAESLEKSDIDQVRKMVKTLTDNAAEYDFVFVGNVDPEILKPLVEQYIASIPGNAKTAVRGNVKVAPEYQLVKGTGTDRTTIEMTTPQTYVCVIESGNLPYTSKEAKIASAVGQILSKRFISTIREREGAVYSIGASGSIDRFGEPNVEIATQFPMKPEMEEKVLKMIADEFKAMESNITEEELAPVREYSLKDLADLREKNNGWLGHINGWLVNGVNSLDNAEQIWNEITVGDLMNFVKKMNAQGNYRVVVMAPAEK